MLWNPKLVGEMSFRFSQSQQVPWLVCLRALRKRVFVTCHCGVLAQQALPCLQGALKSLGYRPVSASTDVLRIEEDLQRLRSKVSDPAPLYSVLRPVPATSWVPETPLPITVIIPICANDLLFLKCVCCAG